jgi:hypothetical protein
MAIDHFEVGKSYRWAGSVGQRPLNQYNQPHPHWIDEMDSMLDGQPHQCLGIGPCDCARFAGCGINNVDPNAGWSWHPWIKQFELVD